MSTVSRPHRRAAQPAVELTLLLLATVLGIGSLIIAVVAGIGWFMPLLVLAAAPVVVAWRRAPSTPGRHRRG